MGRSVRETFTGGQEENVKKLKSSWGPEDVTGFRKNRAPDVAVMSSEMWMNACTMIESTKRRPTPGGRELCE